MTRALAGDQRAVVEVVQETAATVEVTRPDVTVVEVARAVGRPGARGKTGPSAYELAVKQGYPGSVEDWLASLKADASHSHRQDVPAAVWVVEHTLPFRPGVSVTDSAGTLVEGGVVYTGAHALEIHFAFAFSGTAYLS